MLEGVFDLEDRLEELVLAEDVLLPGESGLGRVDKEKEKEKNVVC
jgi:hypothetical protein